MTTDDVEHIAQLTKKKLEKARNLIDNGKTIVGLILYEEIIKFDPRDGYVWLEYADALTEICRFSDARIAYENALQFAPKNRMCFIYARIGILLEESRGIADAEGFYEKAVKSNDEPIAWVLILYGKNLAYQEKYDEAEKILLQAIRLESSEQDEAYLNLAILYRSAKRYDESRNMATKALEINPRYSPAKKIILSLTSVDRKS